MDIRRVNSAGSTSNTQGVKKPNQSAKLAAKVSQVVQFPTLGRSGLEGRVVSRLQQAKNLYKSIRKDWDNLEPEELAEKIVDLEERVSQLKESSPAVEKIKKQAERLHFQFVFPIVLELEKGSHSFAGTVQGIAQKILKTQSLQPMHELSEGQKREVLQIASRSVE